MPAPAKNKTVRTKTIIFFLLSLIFVPISAFCQSGNETITIGTYYPSPYGIYRDLEVKRRMAVGDASAEAKLGGDINNMREEQLYVGDSILLGGLSNDPATGEPGELIYNSADGLLKFHNQTRWINATGFPSCAINATCAACPQTPVVTRCNPLCAENATGCRTCPQTPVPTRCRRDCSLDGVCATCPGTSRCQPLGHIDPSECADCDSCCSSGPACDSCCPACTGSCQSGESCLPSNYTAPCASGESCKADCPNSGCPDGQSCQEPCKPPVACDSCCTGSNVVTVSGTTCPSGYTYLVGHWQSRTCSSSTGIPHPVRSDWTCGPCCGVAPCTSACATPVTWSAQSLPPTCSYLTPTWTRTGELAGYLCDCKATTCSATTIYESVCIK